MDDANHKYWLSTWSVLGSMLGNRAPKKTNSILVLSWEGRPGGKAWSIRWCLHWSTKFAKNREGCIMEEQRKDGASQQAKQCLKETCVLSETLKDNNDINREDSITRTTNNWFICRFNEWYCFTILEASYPHLTGILTEGVYQRVWCPAGITFLGLNLMGPEFHAQNTVLVEKFCFQNATPGN